MLVLDFINVGNGDAILIRDMIKSPDNDKTRFSMLVDCGHDSLIRDDHPENLDPRSRRIYAGDFLRKNNIKYLDMLIITHFHRDHVGGLGRVLDAVRVGKLMASYLPPPDFPDLDPDGDNHLPRTPRNVLRNMNFFTAALREHPGKIGEFVELTGDARQRFDLTDDLSMDIDFADAVLYQKQKRVFDDAFRGVRDSSVLTRWSRYFNVTSLRQRLYYHGKEIVLGGDLYGTLWDRDTTTPCDILKLPHHGSITSATRKFLEQLQPKTIVVSVAAGRPDERPHPAIVSLLREFTDEIYFTDAVAIPGLTEPVFHESARIEID